MTPDQPDAGPRVSPGLSGAIRLIAAAIIRDQDRILVWEDLNPATGEVVAVPLTGGIEFGESGEEAIRRELTEEIGASTTAIRYLGLIEDIYDWYGQNRHELYLIYAVELGDLASTSSSRSTKAAAIAMSPPGAR